MMDTVPHMELLETRIVYKKNRPSTCLNSKEFNINMYDDMVEQRYLPKPQKILLNL
jgi:hypothetical protein